MTKIDGTKGNAGGKVVALRPAVVEAKIEAPEIKEETAPTDDKKPAVFDGATKRDVDFHDATGPMAARGANVKARLAALGVKGAEALPIKTRDVARVKDTPIGKILEGSVVVESARHFQKLEGVVRVTGDLTVQEARLAGADATPAMDLVEIGGRLTIEGVIS
jgi:hypothetical protein